MSALALAYPRRDSSALASLAGSYRRHRGLIAAFAIGFPAAFYLMMTAILIIRYGGLPNYYTPYNWPANVLRIIDGTASVLDMIPIIASEWLIEIGYKNYEFGYGVADWSLSIIPHKLLLLAFVGSLIGLNIALLADQAGLSMVRQCIQACGSGLLVSAGAMSAGVTNITIFSASHCAYPSWIGGLAILGVETLAAYALEPYGALVFAIGIGTLLLSAFWLAGELKPEPAAEPKTNGAA